MRGRSCNPGRENADGALAPKKPCARGLALRIGKKATARSRRGGGLALGLAAELRLPVPEVLAVAATGLGGRVDANALEAVLRLELLRRGLCFFLTPS